MADLDRRTFLGRAAAGAVALALPGCGARSAPPPGDGWDAGVVRHLLPTANHERIRLKASFHELLEEPPRLRVGELRAPGRRADSAGRFYSFDVAGLEAATTHTLRLERASGEPLCESWPLRTFPAPDATPDRFRLLVYTCAGGPDDFYNFEFFNAYLPIPDRQRLFARALSLEPDAVVANGDHVYWDLQSKFGWALGDGPVARFRAGHFDRSVPVVGTPNEDVLVRAFAPQIADLYGVRFRSLPTYFLQDDHDYGENDEASADLRTFPADAFMLDLARSTQRFFYPELLVDPQLPRARVAAGGVSESFGSLRYGRLFEALLYDCRRGLTNGADPDFPGASSRLLPDDVERWLLARTATSPCAHLAHMPSTPVLWSAGKWLEWYPDFKDASGALSTRSPKPYWPEDWRAQHDRLLLAAAARTDRTPLFVSGDLHALAAGRILETGGVSLAANPVVSVLVGAIGTGALGWPSKFRSQRPLPSATLLAEEFVTPLEQNGFSVLDFSPEELRISMYRWQPSQGAEAIDRLEPFHVTTIPARPRG